MSLLEQSRAIGHVQGLPAGAPSQLLSPHGLDSSAPNPDVLLALLTRNKALEGTLSAWRIISTELTEMGRLGLYSYTSWHSSRPDVLNAISGLVHFALNFRHYLSLL